MSWIERLEAAPGAFDFHAVLRRFDVANPALPRLGTADRPSAEAVRLGQDPSVAFAGAALTRFTRDDAGRSRLAVAFFGLWGPQGPLPAHMTEYAYERQRHAGDETLVRFADLFHHRLLLLFHRVWAAARPTVAHDRPDDAFARYVAALAGLDAETSLRAVERPEFTPLHYAGWLASASRSADGLRSIIQDCFGTATEIEENVGGWLPVPDDARFALGEARETSSLGRAVIGARVRSVTHKFRVVLGPFSAEDLERMLPGGAGLELLTSIVRTYTNDEWEWEARLVLRADPAARMQLGRGARLGWTSRLGAGHRDGFDLVVDPVTLSTRRVASRRANP